MHQAYSSGQRKSLKSDLSITLGLTAVIAFFVASGAVSYLNTRVLNQDAELVRHTHEVILGLNSLASYMKDAETGQRGFLLTGSETYLTPYKQALDNIEDKLNDIELLTKDNASQQNQLPALRMHIKAKLAELNETVRLRQTKGFEAALAVVITDRGKEEMDAFRTITEAMQQTESDLRATRLLEMQEAYRAAVISGIISGLLGASLSLAVAHLIRRNSLARQKQEWLQSGQVGLSNSMFGDQNIDQLGEHIITFLAEYCGAQAGVFFVRSGGHYVRVAGYGIPEQDDSVSQFGRGDGILGQAVKDNRMVLLRDVPDGYIRMDSALLHGKPQHLLVAPISSEGEVNALVELGFIHPVNDLSLQLMERASEAIAIAVKSANYRADLQNLLEETQRQAEELQAQGEELRVNNEELEEQSRALKESQAHLEQQQAELEQTNAQLEEQTQTLEQQRDDLSRAKAAVQLKAQELEKASQYKSDFLANMSHELRTPLNSSLILAKLLADNPQGNLTDEQVKFAQTIRSSGNDLLSLINDILDLSKIEAGHMDVRIEKLRIERLISDLQPLFAPLAKQKGLTFEIRKLPGCASALETDRQRLEQILKNLLSNAIKFTEKGSVELVISSTADQHLSFAVTDTGIGISEDKQQTVFDAFKQADGTISRRYGGTGLGLSISRELTRLLGGKITLKSEPNEGSTFVVTLPETFDPAMVSAPSSSPFMPSEKALPVTEKQSLPARAPSLIQDDRETLKSGQRTILVVEDDESFASILYELAHELGFQCLLAGTAEEALVIAQQYMPNAVVLDVGLPDHSGLSVLDRLKRDTRTRHIPVHVVSAGDYAQTALSLGAIGYMLKPVKRDELIEAMQQLETKLDQHMRRVLIVEDDETQRDSMCRLIGSHDVETIAVGTASDCLELLKTTTYDCMVLDLSLPDATGYTLLETLSNEDAYSFPPVIVYTGRDLSMDEEQRLRRYSKSIIIKGAKSPERLLDEVTLFLHQVVSKLPTEQQQMLEQSRNRDAILENRHILVVEDDVRNVYAITSIFEPLGAHISIARNGREALEVLERRMDGSEPAIDLVLMDVMMPEMDGLTATRMVRARPEWKKLPIIMLTAKAMKDDQERCLEAGANDYMAKPLDVEKLLSLVRVWMPR